jgi:hypothetical protein
MPCNAGSCDLGVCYTVGAVQQFPSGEQVLEDPSTKRRAMSWPGTTESDEPPRVLGRSLVTPAPPEHAGDKRPAFPGHGQPAQGRPDTRQRFGWLPGPTWVASAAHMTSAASASRRPRRRNCARRACPAACAAARDSQLDGAAFRPGLVTPRRPSYPPEGHGRSSSLAGDRADLAVVATSARRGRVHIRFAPPVKPGAGRRSPVPIW